MDINEHNESTYYALEGTDELPAIWDSLIARRTEISADEWLEQLKTFLRWHSMIFGSPEISARRTELYEKLNRDADLEQFIVDVSKLVERSETYRMVFIAIEQTITTNINARFGG